MRWTSVKALPKEFKLGKEEGREEGRQGKIISLKLRSVRPLGEE